MTPELYIIIRAIMSEPFLPITAPMFLDKLARLPRRGR